MKSIASLFAVGSLLILALAIVPGAQADTCVTSGAVCVHQGSDSTWPSGCSVTVYKVGTHSVSADCGYQTQSGHNNDLFCMVVVDGQQFACIDQSETTSCGTGVGVGSQGLVYVDCFGPNAGVTDICLASVLGIKVVCYDVSGENGCLVGVGPTDSSVEYFVCSSK